MNNNMLALAVLITISGCATYHYNGPQLKAADSLCRAKTDTQNLGTCIEATFSNHDKDWRSDSDYPYVYSYITYINMLDKQVENGALSKDASYSLAMQYMSSLVQQKKQNEAAADSSKITTALTISALASIVSAGASLYSATTPPPQRQQICNWYKVGTLWQQVCN